jgi:HipA-like protein
VTVKRTVREKLSTILESWGLKWRSVPMDPKFRRTLELYVPFKQENVLVGRLSQEGDEFVFSYAESFKRRDLPVVTAFPDKDQVYRSTTLWPFFQVRQPPTDRADVREFLERENVREEDVLGILATLSRKAVSSPYEFRLSQS